MTPSDKRYFTVSEANAHVDELRQLFDRVMQIRSQLKAISRSLEEAGHPVTRADFGGEEEEEEEEDQGEQQEAGQEQEAGGEEELPPEVHRNRGHFRALVATLREHIEEIQATGAIIKDIESGLVDWYALHDDREVFLCWQYGEPEVAWWHEIHTGFAGRRPIAELVERDQHA